MGFTAIALESGFTESISARSFIEGGEGDAATAARTGLSSGFSRFIENRDLIQWMRDYNATASATGHRRIRFYGIDLPAGARVSGARGAINSALTFLSRADPTTAQKLRDSFSGSLPGTNALEFGSLIPVAQAEFEASINAVASAMQKSRTSLIARSSDDEYRWALHNLDVARQLAKCLPITPPPNAGMSVWVATVECRDSAMAENVQWALKNEGQQGRLLVFAHDSHVMNWKEDGPRWTEVRDKPSMMGLYLRRAYGEDLYIIATSFATASEELPTPKPMQNSLHYTLAGVGLPFMLLDLRMARQNKEVLAWLSTRRALDANISTNSLVTPATAFDGLLFVAKLTPALLSSDEAP